MIKINIIFLKREETTESNLKKCWECGIFTHPIMGYNWGLYTFCSAKCMEKGLKYVQEMDKRWKKRINARHIK